MCLDKGVEKKTENDEKEETRNKGIYIKNNNLKKLY